MDTKNRHTTKPIEGRCAHSIDLVAMLDQRAADSIGRSGMLSTICKQCGETIEIRLKRGGFDVGYSYFGGSMHYESLRTVRVSGMTVDFCDPDDLDITIGDRHWHFGIRHLSRERFFVLPQAFVVGRTVSLVDFASFNVCLIGIERDRVRLEWNPDTIICSRDFLLLEGLSPALLRAWRYMNDEVT